MGGAVLLLLVACTQSSASTPSELTLSGDWTSERERCGADDCELLEGVVTEIDATAGTLVVAVDLAWSPELRTNVGETRFTLSDATLFLPVQAELAELRPGEDVLVRATAEGPAGRHALSVVRVDRD